MGKIPIEFIEQPLARRSKSNKRNESKVVSVVRALNCPQCNESRVLVCS